MRTIQALAEESCIQSALYASISRNSRAPNALFGSFPVKIYSKEPFRGLLKVNFCRRVAAHPYLSQKLAETDDLERREAFLQAIANGSVASWQHINLLGEYDFSDDKLQDSVGIKPPKLAA